MGLLMRVANIRVAACVAACLWATLVAAAEPGAEPGAVHRASEQGMLAQRIVKAYSQIGLKVMPAVSIKQLADAQAAFDANLLALDRESTSDEVKQEFTQLTQLWQALKAGAQSPVSKERVLELSRSADAVEDAGRRLVQALQDRSDTITNRLVSLAGRQSMLGQRIAKAFMLLSWGLESASIRGELDAAANEFSGGLSTLRAQRENSDEIRRELDEVALQWEWLEAAIAAEGAISYRLIVAEATESILVSTARITRMYEMASAP